jgi:hypothetical protein
VQDGRKQMDNKIILTDDRKKQWIQLLFGIELTNLYGLRLHENSLQCPHPQLSLFLNRLEENKVTIVPYKKKSAIHWLILGPSFREVSNAHREIKQFLTPFYVPTLPLQVQHFNDQKSKLGILGKQLFPGGYFSFKTSHDQEAIIWRQLTLWHKLNERRPEIAYEELEVTAFTLRNKFQNAIALQDWGTSKKILIQLQQGHYISDENVMFLQLQLLSAQMKWKSIWGSDDYELLTGLDHLPRKVHYTLLNAFYQTILMETDLDRNFQTSYENYKNYRYRLGTLIRSQLGLDEEETLRIFAYEAGLKGNGEKLHRYDEKTNDPTTKALIGFLLQSLHFDEDDTPPEPAMTKEEQAIFFYQHHQYEDAFLLLLDSPLSVTKVKLLAGIAVMNEGEETCSVAFESFGQLEKEEQTQLLKEPMTKAQIKFVLRWNETQEIMLSRDVTKELEILTWNDWFNGLIQGTESERLDAALYHMEDQEGTIQWSMAMLEQLTEQLTEIALTKLSSKQRMLIETALPMFINEFLQDRRFPNARAYEIYDYVTETMLIYCKKNENNTKVFLRLIDGLLSIDLKRITDYWERVEKWFNFQPTLKLSGYVLDGLEMFLEYGVKKEQINEIWVQWMTVLETQLTPKQTTQIESWVKVGQQLIYGEQLVESLLQKLRYEPEEDPIATISPVTITIFSLREKSAIRAAKRMKDRNPSLDVKVCTDDKLTIEAKTYARNSDIIILVTTCMSHALTYGIGPYIRGEILYSRSSGETSIVETLEQYTY